MSRTEVQAFFETYREAFNRLDGDAVADLWHTPSAITNTRSGAATAQLTLWPDDAPMRANHRALCEIYRGNGYHHADFALVDCAVRAARASSSPCSARCANAASNAASRRCASAAAKPRRWRSKCSERCALDPVADPRIAAP